MEENEDKVEQKAKDVAKNSAKNVSDSVTRTAVNTGKKSIKILAKEIAKLLVVALKSIIPILMPAIIIFILIAAFVNILKKDDAESLTGAGRASINTILNISDISELVTINGTPKKGYSLAFVDDIDEKLEKVLKSDKRYEDVGITEVDTLKSYVKAELVTQLPYLGDGVSTDKLPNLDGVDILYEPEETTNLLINMNNVLIIGDTAAGQLNGSKMLEECYYRYRARVSPSFWLEEDRINELPEDVTAICLLFGINNPNNISEEVSNMEKLVETLNEKYSNNKNIYILKVFPLGKSYEGELTQDKIDDYNAKIQEYCKGKEKVFFIDATSGCTDEVGYLISNDEISPKGMYPKDYQTFVNNIKSQLLVNYRNSSSDELQGSNAKEAVWGYLIGKGFSEEAAAGIMGNWQQESGITPNNLENGSNEKSGVSDEEFTRLVNNGEIKEEEFVSSSKYGLYDNEKNGLITYGYGLAQWTFSTRKRGLYEFAKEQGTNIDDLKMQLDYFMKELEENEGYSSLLKDDFKNISGGKDNIKTASDRFLLVYEGINDGTDDIRLGYAEDIYDEFHGTVPSGSYSNSKRAMAVTDRNVSKENIFQPAIKLKRVIPNKNIGDMVEADGKVIEMKYVPPGVFNAYLNQNNGNVLEVFTINNNREIVFAKWSYENGTIKYAKASSVDISTVMEKYTMPYDYIMMLNVYGEDVELCLDLANLALESEYIIAVQDQVTTTETTTEQDVTVEVKVSNGYDERGYEIFETQTVTNHYSNTEKKEQVSEKIELTYADSWVVSVENEITYLDDDKAERENIESTSSSTTSTEGNTTTTVTTTSVTNKYKSGKTTVNEKEAGDKFVEIYDKSKNFKLLEPDWLFEGLNSNAKTSKMVDLTKYLLYKATNKSYGVENPKEVFSEYQDNEFKEIKQKNKGTVGWEFTRAWENNDLRKYMNDEGNTYDSSTYIYSCVTKDRKKYILHDEIGQSKGNKIYGIEVMTYNAEVGIGWQNVAEFKNNGINIKESEYNIYGESKIDVETVEKISIENANERKEKVELIAKVYKADLEDYQIDCLADIMYENGNVHKIVRFLKENDFDFESMSKKKLEETKKQFQENFEEFTGSRGEARWILLTEGRYCTPINGEELDPSDYFGGGEFYELAYELHEYLRENDYWYPSEANIAAGRFTGTDGKSITQKLPTRGEPTNRRYIDCSSYVSWVISEYTGNNNCWYTGALINNPMNFEVIATSTSQYTEEDLKPGDILVVHNENGRKHAEIYAGDGKTLNCGNTKAIRREFSNYSPNLFTHVFRAPD